MSENKINPQTFFPRLKKISTLFSKEKSNLGIDSFCLLRGKYKDNSDESKQPKTSMTLEYLLGWDFTDTLVLFTSSKVVFYLGQKKKDMLEELKAPENYDGPKIELILKNIKESNEDAIKRIGLLLGNSIGMLMKESGVGQIIDEFQTLKSNKKVKDIDSFIDSLYFEKSNTEIEYLKISGKYSSFIMKALIKKFEVVVDQDTKITNSGISKSIKEISEKPIFKSKFKAKYNLIADDNELAFGVDPIVESGVVFNSEFDNVSNDDKFNQSTIVLKSNGKYKDFNTGIIRTFMIDSDKKQQSNYKIIQEAFEFLISLIKPNAVLSDVYKKVYNFIEDKNKDLLNSLNNSFGFGIGFEFCNASMKIEIDNDFKVLPNQAFYLSLSLLNLKNEKGKTYSIQISDTILTSQTSFIHLTDEVSKSLSDILYNLEEDEEEESNKNNVEMDIDEKIDLNGKRRTRQTIALHQNKNTHLQELAKRKEHQLNLLNMKNKEIKERLEGGDFGDKNEKFFKKNVETIKTYSKPENLPADIQKGKIFVDMKTLSIIMPIFKTMIPFNGNLIKSVSLSNHDHHEFLRINFHTPISGAGALSFSEILKSKDPVFIKDLIYKSTDKRHIENVSNSIQILIKNVKAREKEEKEKADLILQENLVLVHPPIAKLNNVSIRPTFGKKQLGILETHSNGFRFSAQKGEKVDIIFKNIKHAFFQPCDREMLIIVHFHLKNPIILAKKKVNDIQFVREVGSQSDDLHMNRRGNEYDEYQAEIQEQMMKEKMNKEFLNFTEKVQNELKQKGINFEFDIPYKDLAFEGVPNKSSVTLIPTVNCLVNLTEMPFFVMQLDDIEMVYFERVSQGIRNFDMGLIFSNLNKPVHRITCIPTAYLETIKNWLDSVDILFAEGSRSLNWDTLLNEIKKNPKGFIEEGCWSAIHNEVDSEGEVDSEEEEEDDPSFNYQGAEEEEEESEYEEDSEYSDSDLSGGDSELSEEGMSWEEMEKKALKDEIDKEKNVNKDKRNINAKDAYKKRR